MISSVGSQEGASAEGERAADDMSTALRSALVLSASLMATWGVAIGVRFFLPRYLGPERFGAFNFADSFAALSFAGLGLGVETYIRNEIPIRPEHASEFFGGLVVVRVLMSAVIFAAMLAVMAFAHRPAAVQQVVMIFGAMQFILALNVSMAALLHAASAVRELAVINVVSKVLWGVGVGVAMLAHTGLHGLALALLVAESARTVSLIPLVRRYLGVRMVWNPAAMKAVLVASFPFYVSQLSSAVLARLDVSLMSAFSTDIEVGWYSSASNLAALALLASPIINWVLPPLLARAIARSEYEMFGILRRTLPTVLVLVLPVALLLGIGADVWIECVFGSAYAPAVLSLRILAFLFVFTYLAMISATSLTVLGRPWTATGISLAGLVVYPALCTVLVPRGHRWFGPGGAGAGAALAIVLTEFGITVALTAAIGSRVFDRAGVLVIAKTVLCCALVATIHFLLRPLGPVRLAIDLVTYIALVFATGVVRIEQAQQLALLILRKRGQYAMH